MQERPILSLIFSYFVRGLLFAAPVGFTILILYSAFDYVDNIINIKQIVVIPGLGFLIVVVGTIFIGFFVSVVIPQTLQNFLENIIRHLPLVRIIYFSFKDLISAFVGDKRKFNQPVIVVINKETQVHKIGFMTQSDLSNLGLKDFVAVYCPHSYAFSGEMFVVPRENVRQLEIPSAEAMKLIVSGGVSTN